MSSTFDKAGSAFVEFCKTVAALRHPVNGCPWDLSQTHSTLRRYMIEEAYEACEVMDPLDEKKLSEELGDVLLQVVLNAQLGSDARKFSIEDVIHSINAKMRRRHPHVFGTEDEKKNKDKDSIKQKWAEIKSSEKTTSPAAGKKGVFAEVSDNNELIPALKKSVAIGKIAKKINFDWTEPLEVFEQVKSELQEVEQELKIGAAKNHPAIYEEIGDLFFSLAQLCRHLDIDPEVCISDGNRKFLNRFKAVEELCIEKGIDVKNSSAESLNNVWNEAKEKEKAP